MARSTRISHYNVIFREEPEGGFTASVPTLPGCVTYGKDLEEAKKMVRDAITAFIQSLKKHKEPVPTDDNTVTGYIDIQDVKTSRTYAS